MLAREASNEPTWAGTSVPQKAVDDLRAKVSGLVEGFLDEIYDTEVNIKAGRHNHAQPNRADPKIRRLNREIDSLTTGSTDADLIRQIDALTDKAAAGGNVTPATMSVLTLAAARLGQSATRAQAAGLPDAEAALTRAAMDLRTIASGGEGDVEAIIASVRPLIQELRNAGDTVAASNLERDLVELSGGVLVEIGNEDRIEGSVGVTEGVVSERDRYEPKNRTDAELIAEVDRLLPEGERKRGGHFEMIRDVETWVEEEATA
jgi:hypothetical protein